MSRRLSSGLRILVSSLVILSMLLPGAPFFVPHVAQAQSDSPLLDGDAGAEISEIVPTPFPTPDWAESPASDHPLYSPTFAPFPEPSSVLVDGNVNAATVAETVDAATDTEAGKSGVVSGVASATVNAQAGQVSLGALQLSVNYSQTIAAAALESITIQAEVLPSDQANTLSPVGMAFRLAVAGQDGIQASAVGQPLQLTLDYSQIPLRYGGSFKERLTLYRVRPCAADQIAAGAAIGAEPCRIWEALRTANDLHAQQLRVDLSSVSTPLSIDADDPVAVTSAAPTPDQGEQASVAALTEQLFLPLIRSGASASSTMPEPVEGTVDDELLVLAAAASSQQGSYQATPLANVSDYQVSLATGSAQAGYPVPIPPAAAGLDPDVALHYDSGGVDGMSVNKNNQPDWVGIGWSLEPGYILRRTKTCGLSQAPGDLCLTGDNYVLVFNGVASPLVKDGSSLYHPQNDPRWKIEKLVGATGHPDYHKEYWQITTPDGTKYRFGGEFDTDKSNADQNSAFYTPMYDSTCSGANLGGANYWVCNKAWRWNLDRVEDTNGNVISYYYEQEINYYNARTFIRLPYTRAGNLLRIEYGRRTGSTSTPTQVVFNTENRCEGACTWPTNYPDTPGDLECAATGTCTQTAPTFWSKKRLNTIVPQYYNTTTSAWVNVAQFDLDYSFPPRPLMRKATPVRRSSGSAASPKKVAMALLRCRR